MFSAVINSYQLTSVIRTMSRNADKISIGKESDRIYVNGLGEGNSFYFHAYLNICDKLVGNDEYFVMFVDNSIVKLLSKLRLPYNMVYDGSSVIMSYKSLQITQKTLNVKMVSIKDFLNKLEDDRIGVVYVNAKDFLDNLSTVLSISDYVNINISSDKIVFRTRSDITDVSVNIPVEGTVNFNGVFNMKFLLDFIKLFDFVEYELHLYQEGLPLILHAKKENGEVYFIQAAVS